MSADTPAARIRERARLYRMENADAPHLTQSGFWTEERAAAFALSELSAAEKAARKDEREQCATLADEITIYTNDDCSRVRNRIVTAIRNRE